jgi:hypothetical protein
MRSRREMRSPNIHTHLLSSRTRIAGCRIDHPTAHSSFACVPQRAEIDVCSLILKEQIQELRRLSENQETSLPTGSSLISRTFRAALGMSFELTTGRSLFFRRSANRISLDGSCFPNFVRMGLLCASIDHSDAAKACVNSFNLSARQNTPHAYTPSASKRCGTPSSGHYRRLSKWPWISSEVVCWARHLKTSRCAMLATDESNGGGRRITHRRKCPPPPT